MLFAWLVHACTKNGLGLPGGAKEIKSYLVSLPSDRNKYPDIHYLRASVLKT